MNDNKPIFAEGSLTQEFRVRERSTKDTVIGSVTATDIDGPLYNRVHYSIVPVKGTPEHLVKIDLNSGQITVHADSAIDADEPPRHFLYYTVIASDRCLDEECPPDPTFWNQIESIQIEIIDTNDKIPEADTSKFNTTLTIYEDVANTTVLERLVAIDLDRDGKLIDYDVL
ncbi:hypothetical protein ACJJTC_004867 [Scirpophaga incertulas]